MDMNKYELVFEDLQKKVFDGKISYEDAEKANQAAFDKYVKGDDLYIESSFKDEPDIFYNKVKYENGDINLLFITGYSGGGKSTVVSLLPRFYDVTSGAILINGVDVRDMTLESLRANIGVVFQDNFLFSGTIRENIMLGNENATEKELQKAVEMACLEDVIKTLPGGLDAEIGERGVLLSGGQKQRVAIARAFLKNAPILILDEATSALDNKAEAVVQKAIENLMKDKTVFVIAHRLSTIQNADNILVINRGEIVESGTHEELLKNKNGAYKLLYDMQFKGRKKKQ
jgi:subfamily B ATP-binding cassette protein MsbA